MSLIKVMRLLGRLINFVITIFNYLCWSWRLGGFGWRSRLGRCVMLTNPAAILIGKKVIVRSGARLEAIGLAVDCQPKITIGDGSAIQFNFHCGAVESVTIGVDVVIGGNVYITDHDHCYDDPALSVRRNVKLIASPVVIEDECWLGEGCVILKGVTVGRRSVVGANAVVTKSIPPYSVACGNPARVIKTFKPS